MIARKLIVFLTSISFLLPIVAYGQVSNNQWIFSGGTIKPAVASWTETLPYLGGGGTQSVCVTNAGLLSVSGCSGSSGSFGTSSIFALFPLSWNTATAVMSFLGLGTTSPWTIGNLSYVNSSNSLTSVATSSLAVGASISNSGTLGAQVGGTASSLSLNTGNANSWTALQQFTNASTSLFSAYGPAYFGGTATTTISLNGVINVPGSIMGYQQNGITILYASSTNSSTLVGDSTNSRFFNISGAIYNTAIGYRTLGSSASFNGSADYNTSVGGQALFTNTGGSWNTAIGAQAMQNNTTGATSTAVGESALISNTTGGQNVGVGAFALEWNNTGNDNTAVGYGAGATGIGASQRSTFIGSQTNLVPSVPIVDTTELGYQAGYNNTGWDSTFLGEQAGQNNTSGNNNIAIGFNALMPSATASNQMNIGNLLFGTNFPATSSSATNLIFPLSGTFGIGTSTPWAKFSIQSNSGDTNRNLFVIASSTLTGTTTAFRIDNAGHQFASSTNPTLSSCGTTPALVGSDHHGTITAGAAASGCTITFGQAYPSAPTCVVSNQSMSVVNAMTYTESATALTISEVGLGGALFDYICFGNASN